MMMRFVRLYTALWLLLVGNVSALKVPDFNLDDAKSPENLRDLTFVSRIKVPYGPDIYSDNPTQTNKDRPYAGYGYGMAAVDLSAYDPLQKYFYAVSGAGFINILDWEDPSRPSVTNLAMDMTEQDDVQDIKLCPEQGLMFFAIPDAGTVAVYETVQRESPREPSLIRTIKAGLLPMNLLLNSDCTLLVVANENRGEVIDEGAVSLIRPFDNDWRSVHKKTMIKTLALDSNGDWDDKYVLDKGLHMPLTKNALEYWDTLSPLKDKVDFAQVRQEYKASIFLEPENLAWSTPDETELLVNLQKNNGLIRIDVVNEKLIAMAGYGLKDHGEVPIDINPNDKKCDLKLYPNLFALRSPDSIATFRYNGKKYVVTANEGSDKDYGEFEEKIDAKDLFPDANNFGLPNFTVPPSVFVPGDSTAGNSAPFHAECEGVACVGDTGISLGSSAIDFESDPKNPIFYRMVIFGGRGWSIFEVPDDDDSDSLLKLVFDSGDDAERTSCEKMPWAYNAILEDEQAPVGGALWHYLDDEEDRETLRKFNDPEQDGCADQGDGTPGACPFSGSIDDQSDGDGPDFEHVITGVACGRLIAIAATEKSSMAWLYDITNIASPTLVKAFHMSPANQFKSPGLAYEDGSIGDLGPEWFYFLSPQDSPSGKAAVMFTGGYSGTLSFWEFDCIEDDDISEIQN